MKNRIFSIVLIISIVLLALMGFTSCGEDTTQPQKLSAPVVTLNGNTASWEANANADRFEISIDGSLSFVENTTTSKTLLEGQTLKVRAIGDGINYTTGDWSNSVTYRENNTPIEGEAPTYLGIFASNSEPSQADGLPINLDTRSTISYKTIRAESYRAFGTALDEYFTNSDNYLEDALPVKSSYDAYARAGEAIYIQIWLNNPSQHTILSLKLNGTKYQVGGGLSSFFVEDNGQKYNCIYVAVTIPSEEYTEKAYTVTDIEYIADTYINPDGTDEFMNENDTVTIGLPYNAQSPVISNFNPTSLTMNSCSATLTVEDKDQLANLSGGWLGIAVYDGYNIVANQSLVIGNNTVSASGLVENTRYSVIAYLYADLHDGNGVTTHILFEQSIRTPEAITVNEINGALLYNSEKDGYYGAITVNTTLNSNTAQYIKLEILNYDDEVVYTDTSFNGFATISSGILCGESYKARIYYKDTEYPEGKYIEQDTWVDSLGTPWYQEYGAYTFVNDAVYYFQLSNGDKNYPAINSFSLKLYKQESARWVATDVLYILENPTAIDDLTGQIDALYAKMNELPRGEEMDAVYNQIQELQAILEPLDYAKWYLENRADNNTDKSYWQNESVKGKYFYEFEYNGTNTEKLFKQGKTFYVVLDDILTYEIGGLDIALTYNYDKLDGNGPFDEELNYQSINLDREVTNHWVEMENVSYSNGELTLTLFNEADRWTGYRPPFAIGYVYKVEVDGKTLYIDESKHTIDVDEQAWFNEYIALVKAEQTVDGLMEKYVPDYKSSYTVPIDKSKLEAGSRNFGVYIRLVNTSYKDDEYHACRWANGVAVYTQIQKPIIEYKELWGEFYGVVTPESVDNWYNDHYEYEAIDKNGNPFEIKIASEAGYALFNLPTAGTKVRVKIPASGYWLESEWSDWYTFKGIKISAPTLGEYDKTTCKISWSANTENVSHYLYTINDGAQVRVELNADLSLELENNDILRVKCVVSEEGLAKGYLDSDWVQYTCTDSRQRLSTPTNLKIEEGSVVWGEITGASKYIIEQNYNNHVEIIEQDFNKWPAKVGATFRIRAIPDDSESYKPSDWSEPFTYSVKLSNPEYQEILRERVYWTSVDYAQGYNYKLGENGEVNTVRSYYLALADIPSGESLYVQAYATGCESSDWVLIYTNEA